MFWVTFIVSGLIVASIPWVASHFSDQIAGFLVLLPVMMTLSIVVQYLSHGTKATTAMIQAMLWGLPTLLVFGLVAMLLLKHHVALAYIVVASLVAWLASVLAVNGIIGK